MTEIFFFVQDITNFRTVYNTWWFGKVYNYAQKVLTSATSFMLLSPFEVLLQFCVLSNLTILTLVVNAWYGRLAWSGVAPRTGKIINNGLSVLERGENGILHFVLKFKPIVRYRVTKLEFTQTKNGLYWKWLGT